MFMFKLSTDEICVPSYLPGEQGSDLIDLQLTWREMENLILRIFGEILEDFWRFFEEFEEFWRKWFIVSR